MKRLFLLDFSRFNPAVRRFFCEKNGKPSEIAMGSLN
jgi:hypothetical protein